MVIAAIRKKKLMGEAMNRHSLALLGFMVLTLTVIVPFIGYAPPPQMVALAGHADLNSQP